VVVTIELGTDILDGDQKTKKHETYNSNLSLNTQTNAEEKPDRHQ
jgi:hypothetical protein